MKMSAASIKISQTIERILRQRFWVTVLHTTAILVVPLCYWIGHTIPIMPNPRLKGGWIAIGATIFA